MSRPYSHRDDPRVPDFDDSAPLAVVDGSCALCSWAARLIHRLDRSGRVRIAPIQSSLGAALARHYGLDPDNPDSWLFLDAGRPHTELDAAIRAGRHLGWLGRLAQALRLVPRPLRDRLYRLVARNRYRLFGRAELCALPDPAFQRRLLG